MMVNLTKEELQLMVNMLHGDCNNLRKKISEKDHGIDIIEAIQESIEYREKLLRYLDSKIPKDY